MTNQQLAENKLNTYNQEHILEFIKKLDNTKKQIIINQISQIDFDKLMGLYEDTKKEKDINQNKITPIDYIDKEKISTKEKEELQELGEQIIKNDEYAVVTMAGGQGTRLGFNGPKGTFKLDVDKKGKYIFEILADNLKKSSRLYNILPFWYIMTSQENNAQTIEFFEKHNYFRV